MKRTILAAALGLATALPAAAQKPATITGRVYACETGAPLAHAAVRLRGLDDGSAVALTSDAGGRFARVGLAPGRYLIEATPPLPTQPLRHGHWVAPTASRLARLETDDVLDLRIGTAAPERSYGVGPVRRPGAPESTAPQPACDDPLVPPAVPTADRYIIH
jgi:carboxypeptidase family protein